MNDIEIKFAPGQLVHHKLFHYRGVIIDVDAHFKNSNEWYEMMAKSKPSKKKPWYHVLVHNGFHMTYVAEQNLEADKIKMEVNHPLVGAYFSSFEDGTYIPISQSN